jgi:hypothetical protein
MQPVIIQSVPANKPLPPPGMQQMRPMTGSTSSLSSSNSSSVTSTGGGGGGGVGGGNGKEQIAEARYAFSSEGGEFLAFEKGDKILILGKEEDNYYSGRNLRSGDEGIFPAKYVKLI